MRIVSVELGVNSTLGPLSYECRLEPGLNVLNARNTWGKSTLLQGIVFGLGLEGALSTSRRSPMGPAMTQTVLTSMGRAGVVESYVTITLANERGQFLRARRWAKNPDFSENLMQVYTSDSEPGLDGARRQDMFVREAGATFSAVGFHRLLEQFLGWSLPLVPDYSGGESRLYLEVLFPLFYVEQKFGWSGVAPRIPTHFRIRDPVQRAVEYSLGLTRLDQIKARAALRAEEVGIGEEWSGVIGRLIGAAAAENVRLLFLPSKPVANAQLRSIFMEVSEDGRWIPLETAEAMWRDRIAAMSGTPVLAGSRSGLSRSELEAGEVRARNVGAVVRDLREQHAASRADQDALAARLAAVGSDKRRLQDIQRIRILGGELELPLIAEGRCPTCQQEVDGRAVASGTVSSVEDNVALLDAERVTLLAMQAAAQARNVHLESSIQAAESDLTLARNQVRLLRDELIGPSNAPSLSEVQERLTLESRLRGATAVRNIAVSVEHELEELSERINDLRSRQVGLEDGSVSSSDAGILADFRIRFQQQLESYGLRSLKPSEVNIDERTLLPVNEGFELSFDVALGISASDAIRTKWAYHTALFEAAIGSPRGHHMGFLVLDEPRQQETEHNSLEAFLERLDHDNGLGQIIYATSEDEAVMAALLADIPHTSLPAYGARLLELPAE